MLSQDRCRSAGSGSLPPFRPGRVTTNGPFMTLWRKVTTALAIALCAVDLIVFALGHRHAPPASPGDASAARHQPAPRQPTRQAPAAACGEACSPIPNEHPDSCPCSRPTSPDDANDCSLCRHLAQPVTPPAPFLWSVTPSALCTLARQPTPQVELWLAASHQARGPPQPLGARTVAG